MTIAEHCASCFHPEVWTRGLILYQQGRVTLTAAADSRLTATVQPPTGTPYHVDLAFDLVLCDLEAICTCPDYGMGTLCHHIWATVLTADAAGWLQESLTLLDDLTVSHQDEDPELPEPDISDERRLLSSLFGTLRQVERGRVIPLPRRPDRRPPTPKPPTWQDHLQRIIRHTTEHPRRIGAAGSRSQPRARRAWYVWNIDMSLEVGGLLVRGDDTVPLSDPVLLLAEGLVLFPRHVSRLEASPDFGWIATLRHVGELRIPYAGRDAFLQLWWSAP